MTGLIADESVCSVEYSQDASLMAVGSSQSCIRLWSLKGEKLKGKTIGGYWARLFDQDVLNDRWD